jgi:2-oxo-3-hexenedioate decarboxylase
MPPDQGYATALRFRERRLRQGWRAVGRKIGFTNSGIWPRYGVHEPIWGTVFDRTVLFSTHNACAVSLRGLSQPRIEPEICFMLKAAPRSSATQDLLSCVEWTAHSIEIVQCDQPGWKTSLAHSTAANGLHGLLIVGTAVEAIDLLALPAVELLLKKGEAVRPGRRRERAGQPAACPWPPGGTLGEAA